MLYLPYYSAFQMPTVEVESKAWVTAKAWVWVTGLVWMAVQMSESESEADGVRLNLWETLQFVPPAWM